MLLADPSDGILQLIYLSLILLVFSVSVAIPAWLDSSTHGCWTASCSLFKMENSWEAAAEICLSATHHIKWPDLLSFLTKNVHNHDDKCEPHPFIFFGIPGKFLTFLRQCSPQFIPFCQKEGLFPVASPLVSLVHLLPLERSEQATPSLTLFACRQGEGKYTHLSLEAVCLKGRLGSGRPPLQVPLLFWGAPLCVSASGPA